MGVILLETTDTSQARESSREFVTMKNTKISETNRKLTVTSFLVAKHQTMAGTIHRLQGKLFLVNLETKHVFLVLLSVAGLIPELQVEHVGCNDFGEPSVGVLGLVTNSKQAKREQTFHPFTYLDQVHQSIVDTSTMRKHKSGTRRQFMEEEKLLFLSLQTIQYAILSLLLVVPLPCQSCDDHA